MKRKKKHGTPISGGKLDERLPSSELSTRAVPVDVWLAAVEVFQGAAEFKTPIENPEQYGITIDGVRFAFTDGPMNRGLLAVRQLVNSDPQLFIPIGVRCMSFGAGIEAARRQPRFAPFFKEETGADGSWQVAESLIGAFAQAAFDASTGAFDLDSVYLHSERLRAIEEAEDAARLA